MTSARSNDERPHCAARPLLRAPRRPAPSGRSLTSADHRPHSAGGACQFAWLTLVRRDDVELSERGFAWLAAVAIREGWRLARVPRAVPSGAFRGDHDLSEHEHPEPLAIDVDLEAQAIDRSEHEARVDALEHLKSVEARDLYLLAVGYSYAEIAELTGASYSAVNRHIARARAKLAGRRTSREENRRLRP